MKCFIIYFQVKQGAENMIQSLTSGHSRDKKLLQEAQQMLADSRVKIEFLKLRILKIKQNKQLRQQQGYGDTSSNGDTHQAKGETKTVVSLFCILNAVITSCYRPPILIPHLYAWSLG